MDNLMFNKETVSDVTENSSASSLDVSQQTNETSVTMLMKMAQKALNAKPSPIRRRALCAYFHGKHCGKCSHEFQPEEAVYRLRIFFDHDGWGYPDHHIAPVCKGCEQESFYRVRTYSEPCGGCGRSVYHPSGFWNRKHSFCCRDCEIKLRNKLQAEKRRRYRGWIKTKCYECKTDFSPKRSDAEYCSTACKQKAYRNRRST